MASPRGTFRNEKGWAFLVVTMRAYWNLEVGGEVQNRNAKNQGARQSWSTKTVPPKTPLAPTLRNENHLQSEHTIEPLIMALCQENLLRHCSGSKSLETT